MLSRIWELVLVIAPPSAGGTSKIRTNRVVARGLQTSVARHAGRREDDEAVRRQLDPLEPELEVAARCEQHLEWLGAVERDRRALGSEARRDLQRSAAQQ